MRALAFSGGKDSLACLHWMLESGHRLNTLLYVDTGYAYPETQALVEYASRMVPVQVIQSDRAGQNTQEGIPSDVVPVEWTAYGQQYSHEKPVTIQADSICCLENIGKPLLAYAKKIGVTHLYYGQKRSDTLRGGAKDGDIVDGVMRLHPIESWTDEQVLAYLKTKMEALPAHYAFQHTSLDCYDCTGFAKYSRDRIAWMQVEHPTLYRAYAARWNNLTASLQEALA